MKDMWEKIFEYASVPVHGTLSRKLRKGVSLQVNGNSTFEQAVIFLGEKFVRITVEGEQEITNSYYDWNAIQSMKTVSPKEGTPK